MWKNDISGLPEKFGVKKIDVNFIWPFLVLVHLIGSAFSSVCSMIPFASFVVSIAVWAADLYLLERDKLSGKKGKGIFIGSMVLLAALMGQMDEACRGSLLLYLITIGALFWIGSRLQGGLKGHIKIRSLSPGCLALTIFCGLGVYLVALYVNALSVLWAHNYVADAMEMNSGSLPARLLVYALIPAFLEECWFRGLILEGLPGRGQKLVTSALLFALLHMNFNQMSYAFVIGIIFAGIVLICDNLLVTITMHFLVNALSLLIHTFQNHVWVKALFGIHIGPYALFGPDLTGSGGIAWANLLIGFGICALILLEIFGIAWCFFTPKEAEEALFTGTEIDQKEVSSLEASSDWKEREGFSADAEELKPESALRAESAFLKEASADWKPGAAFLVTSFVCLAMAVLTEWMM